MKTLLWTIVALLLAAPCAAQIAVVDTDPTPFTGSHSGSGSLMFSQGITISPTADVLVVDLGSLANSSWAGFNFSVNGDPLIQATGQVSTTGTYRPASSIFYLANPPSGSLTLLGTFGNATAGALDWYTLSGVNTAAPVAAASANGGSSSTASITLSTSAGAFAAVDQAVKSGASSQTYTSTSGTATAFSGQAVSTLYAGDGSAIDLSAGPNTLTAAVNFNGGTNHPISVAVFAAAVPSSGSSYWTDTSGAGNWSAGANWHAGVVPNGAGQVATFAQTGGTETVMLDNSPTIGGLVLGTSAGGSTSYNLTGGTLNLANSGGGVLAMVYDDQEIDSQITGSESLTMQGTGQLILSNPANDYTGGTVVESGTLIVSAAGALPDGSSLTIGAGGTLIFDPSVSGSPAVMAIPAGRVEAVPEPSTLWLLIIGVSSFVLKRRWGKGK
jgi:autotransporter-associated beta strand protein